MKKITLKPFQINAIEELKGEVLHKWRKSSRQEITFQSPTGSGKTVMIAQFVKDLVNAPELDNSDFTFLWASIGGAQEGDLAQQSRDKFNEYYGGASEVDVTGLDSLSREKVLEQHEILFFNWSKIRTSNSAGRKLRRESEQEITWDGMINRTHEEQRKIILIIDEAHAETTTLLTEEEIDFIKPIIVIKITATHRDQRNIDVKVEHNDVVAEGLIKRSIKSQTKDDFVGKNIKDLNKYLLELSMKKRKELKKEYENLHLDINPLIMVQLPNDDSSSDEMSVKKSIEDILGELEVPKEKIGIWLDKEKKNLENITINNNEVEILLFKQAAAVGWDCPRAQIILMYREIQNPTFQIQVLGRVLRMPEGKHYNKDILNHSYLYTNHSKSELIASYDNYQGENVADIYHTHVKKDIKQTELKTYKSQRTRYADLGKTFQQTFIKVANTKFNSAESKQTCLSFPNVDIDLIADAKISDYDNFLNDIMEASNLGQTMSSSDVEKLYKKLCIEVLHKQEKETKFKNISRSYSKLKSAIDVWFEDHIGLKDKDKYYPCVVNDLLRDANSILLPVINDALSKYVVVREKEEEEKDKRLLEQHKIKIPKDTMSYSAIYKKYDAEKCAMEQCYISNNNDNEENFVNYLEGNDSVEWWYKNGDNGAEHFSVKREDGKLFYPDWFVKTKNSMWILDTKSGFTAEGEHAKVRVEALEKWLKKNKEYKGGLVKMGSGLWKIAKSDSLNWVNLDLI